VGGATEIQPPVPVLCPLQTASTFALEYVHYRCPFILGPPTLAPSPWNTCTTGAPSSSGRQRLRPVHQDRALSSTFLSDKSIRFKQLYIQIFEFRPLEFLKKLSSSPSYRFPCSQLAAPSETRRGGGFNSKMYMAYGWVFCIFYFLLRLAVAIHHYLSRVILLF
jgi:hypothetical protein